MNWSFKQKQSVQTFLSSASPEFLGSSDLHVSLLGYLRMKDTCHHNGLMFNLQQIFLYSHLWSIRRLFQTSAMSLNVQVMGPFISSQSMQHPYAERSLSYNYSYPWRIWPLGSFLLLLQEPWMCALHI